MRNLIVFFTRHSNVLLFLLLETISGYLVVRNNHYQRAQFLNSSNAVAGAVYETWSGITGYFGLKEENKKLADENVRLHNLLREVILTEKKNPELVKDTLRGRQYQYIPAKVVNNSVNRRKNYITLNAGSADGVEKEMGVICSEGIVGIVRDVSGNFSSVMSVLHGNVRIPVTIKRFNENSFLVWQGEDERYARLERIPSHLELQEGDTVVASAYSSIFPEGIMAGTVESFEQIPGMTFYNVSVKLSVNYNRLSYVAVIKNVLRSEQVELEKTQQ